MAGIEVDNLEVFQNPDYRNGLKDGQSKTLTPYLTDTHNGQR